MNTKFDVVIIGSGMGGSASALALSKMGISVVVLESGPSYNPDTDYKVNSTNWESFEFPAKTTGHGYTFSPMQPLLPQWDNLRSWNHITGKMVLDQHRKGYKYHHVRGVGGSSLRFSAEAHRLNPASMKMRTNFGVAADWPIEASALEPYYQQAEYYLAVSGYHRPALNAARQNLLTEHELSYASRVLGNGAKKLGWDWRSNSVSIPSKPFVNRPPCNYCGQCGRGCSRQDKGSADIAFIRPALATGDCTVKKNCHVLRINSLSNDRISNIDYIDDKGFERQITTRVLIVSAGAVLTPKLLLNSVSLHCPEGLGNESGEIGKNFMETLFWTASALHPTRLDSFRGIPSDAISWYFSKPRLNNEIIGGFRLSPNTLEADLAGPIAYATRVVDGWGEDHFNKMKALFGHVLSVGAIGENLPNERSFVDLDATQKDQFGQPVARINSYLPEMELKRLSVMADACRNLLAAAGVDKIFEEYGSYDMFSSTHVFGTCRMGLNSSVSVVNEYCQSHRWKNLFIVDASVFPSSGSGEAPSLTIAALAFRTAEYIRTQLTGRNI